MGYRTAMAAATAVSWLALGASGAGATTLYDQYGNAGVSSTNSQDYETAGDLDQYTDRAADDFTVPTGQEWTVSSLDWQGSYDQPSGMANSFYIYFYENSGGIPGDEVATRFNVPYTNDSGHFAASIQPVTLEPGTYWLTIQARQDLADFGHFNWQDRAVKSGRRAVWENPQDGFGTGCAFWDVRATCLSTASAPDQVFSLSGSSASIPPPNTRITNVKLNRPKRRVKLGFAGTNAPTGFECSLKRAHGKASWSSCEPPQKYSRLKPGRYTFLVRALGPGGTDPTPATTQFRIRGSR